MIGINTTCFAYGVTGSGKTHTIFGDLQKTSKEKGISELAVELLFSKLQATQQDFHIKLSYLEIYNEQVKDLLSDDTIPLMIVEEPIKGITVTGLTEYVIDSPKFFMQLVLKGNQRRTVGETAMNQFSSRSHAMLQLSVSVKDKMRTVAKLSFIDLAGSERAAVTRNRGLRLFEGANINRSLLALGECIKILSDKRKVGSFVPYRDSKLTRLLKESLGGNAKTIMIACISPTVVCYEEAVNTLKYAERAKRIEKKVFKNIQQENVGYYKEVIEGLKSEIEQLKKKLSETTVKEDKVKDIRTDKIANCISAKYEEYCEMKKSLEELKSIESENTMLAENMKTTIGKLRRENDITQLENEVQKFKELMGNIKENEQIKRTIEDSLEKNITAQKELSKIVEQLDDSQKKGILELQLAIRTLRLQNMDLIIQNIEMKKKAWLTELEHEQSKQQISQMTKQLQNLRTKLERKKTPSTNKHKENKISIRKTHSRPIITTRKTTNHYNILEELSSNIETVRSPANMNSGKYSRNKVSYATRKTSCKKTTYKTTESYRKDSKSFIMSTYRNDRNLYQKNKLQEYKRMKSTNRIDSSDQQRDYSAQNRMQMLRNERKIAKNSHVESDLIPMKEKLNDITAVKNDLYNKEVESISPNGVHMKLPFESATVRDSSYSKLKQLSMQSSPSLQGLKVSKWEEKETPVISFNKNKPLVTAFSAHDPSINSILKRGLVKEIDELIKAQKATLSNKEVVASYECHKGDSLVFSIGDNNEENNPSMGNDSFFSDLNEVNPVLVINKSNIHAGRKFI